MEIKRDDKGRFAKGTESPLHWKGKHFKHSEETKEKIRQSNIGRKFTEEHKSNISKSKKGKLIGNNNPNYKGGEKELDGYIFLRIPGNNLAKRNYVKRCNLVWFENTGEVIKSPYMLHHINGDKHDDRFENLQRVNKKEHMSIHFNGRYRNKMGRLI